MNAASRPHHHTAAPAWFGHEAGTRTEFVTARVA